MNFFDPGNLKDTKKTLDKVFSMILRAQENVEYEIQEYDENWAELNEYIKKTDACERIISNLVVALTKISDHEDVSRNIAKIARRAIAYSKKKNFGTCLWRQEGEKWVTSCEDSFDGDYQPWGYCSSCGLKIETEKQQPSQEAKNK